MPKRKTVKHTYTYRMRERERDIERERRQKFHCVYLQRKKLYLNEAHIIGYLNRLLCTDLSIFGCSNKTISFVRAI